MLCQKKRKKVVLKTKKWDHENHWINYIKITEITIFDVLSVQSALKNVYRGAYLGCIKPNEIPLTTIVAHL